MKPTALRARKSAAKPALWFVLWQRYSRRIRAAAYAQPLAQRMKPVLRKTQLVFEAVSHDEAMDSANLVVRERSNL